jgi:undecaprenyl-diphosphatase
VWITKIGTHGLVWLVLALVVTVLWRSLWPLVLVAIAVFAADGIAGVVKAAVGEKRPNAPDPLVTIPHSHSFPSGHTATAVAGAIVLSWLVPRFAPLFAILAAAVAYSRVYVGVHFPLDIAGGAVIGALTALLLLAIARRRSMRSLLRG